MKTNTSENYPNTPTLIVDTCPFYRFFRKNISRYYWNNPTLLIDTCSFYKFLSKLPLFQKCFPVLFICGLHFTALPPLCFVFKEQHMMGYKSFYFSRFWICAEGGNTVYWLDNDLKISWRSYVYLLSSSRIFIAWRAKIICLFYFFY